MHIRDYKPSDCKEIAELFYNTVHSINAIDYSTEQLDVWASGKVNLQEWNDSFIEHYTLVAVDNDTLKYLAKVLDEEELRFWNDHFERLETIKRKYDPYREFEPQGLDGGFREEERERHAENNLLNLYPEPVLDRLPTLLAVLVCSLVFTLKHPSNCCIC